MTNKTIAIYARYSSDLQKETSIDDQIAICRALIATQKLDGKVIIFRDKVISGSALQNRPDALNLLHAVKGGKVAFVVTEGLDRLSRDLENMAAIYKICQYHEVEIFTSREGKVNKMHIGFTGTISSMYLDNLAEHIKRGQAGLVRGGKIPGGLSYGYAVKYLNEDGVPEAGLRTVDKEQAKTVRWIYDAFIDGMSCTKILADLNRRRVPPPRGKFWNLTTITGHTKRYGTGILRNPVYTGEVIWNRVSYVINPITMARLARVNVESEWVRNYDPDLQIITTEQWEAAKEEWKKRERSPSKKPVVHKKLIIKILCGNCGCRMYNHDANYLICSRYKRSKQCDFGKKINIRKLEQTLSDTILNDFHGLWSRWQDYHADENTARKAERNEYFKKHRKNPKLEYLPPIDDLHKAQILRFLRRKNPLESIIEGVMINMNEVGHYRLNNIKPNWKKIMEIIYPNHD